MMNWSTILLGLVALTSVAMAENSYLIMVPKLLKVGYDNQISVFIATASQPVVDIKFDLVFGQRRVEGRLTLKAGETRNVTLTIPREFPVGAAELIITGTGGLRFEEHRDVIIYDNRHVLLVQTSASTYWPEDDMLIRVLAMNENLIPLEQGELNIEIYDAALKLVGEFSRVPIRSGLTEMLRFPLGSHINTGSWLVSAVMQNTTSSVEVLVAQPSIPSFDLKAIFQRFLLRTDKVLRGVIEIDSDSNEPLFGNATVAINAITEQEIESKMQSEKPEQSLNNDDWKQWKSQKFEIAGRSEINYDLLSLFNVDVSKAIAIQVYIKVTGLVSGHERVIRHIIPVFARDIIYDIRPLEFQSGIKNEFEVMAKRPDGKPVKMEDLIVSVRMIIGDEQGKQKDEQIVEIKDFYTRGRNDIGFFNMEIPENVIGVLMTITPLDESGKVRGYRTRALPLMPMSRRRGANGAKLSIELLPSTVAPVNTNVNVPVISSQISTVGRTSNFYVQLIPSKPVTKFERLPMSYVLMTNGRITLSGEFHIEPTRECQTRTARAIRPEEQQPPMCLFNGTLPIQITREMIPYSTLLVYTFQPSFGFNVAESYRFSVAGLFQNAFTLNATIVPFSPKEERVDAPMQWKDMSLKAMDFSPKVQDRTRVELSFTGAADSTVGLNVFEYDGVLQGLSNEITKERVLKHLTTYENVPFRPMPTMESSETSDKDRRTISEQDEEEQIEDERLAYRTRFPVERLIFGVSSAHQSTPVEGDDIYTTSNMGRLYGDAQQHQSPSSHYRRKLEKSLTQYDVAVEQNDYVVATSMPIELTVVPPKQMKQKDSEVDVELNEQGTPLREQSQRGTPSWFEKMHMKLNSVSQEAMTFMQSGITIVSDFESLRLPQEMKHENFTKLFSRLRQRTTSDRTLFSIRDDARLLLEDYVDQADLSMVPPPIMLEEQTRMGYYRSIFFNTSRTGVEGTGKVVLPRMKPYSTWLATGFALNARSGLSVAQPIRLPTTQGLYILAHCVERVRLGERVMLAFAVNNYLGKDLSNVVVRIRRSADYDLYEQSVMDRTLSSQDKDYTFTIPSMKSWAVETRHLAFVPKRPGVIQLVMEVESEFGGDYEVVTVLVREPGMRRSQLSARVFDLTGEKKTFGPVVEKLVQANTRRPVQLTVSGTGLDRFVNRHTSEINNLVGIDRALVQLYRSLALRRYLNETNQADSVLYHMTTENITVAYQGLQVFHDYNGSYSLMSDEQDREPSLYLTALAFGAMISPVMPFRDDVVLNRTFSWIASRQQVDGSFDDNSGECFHYRFCAGEFRRESLTAMVLYALTRDNATLALPEYIRERLYNGEQSVVFRAQRYLESRVPAVRSNILVLSLFEIAFIQNPQISAQLREKIREAVLARKLTQDMETDSRFWKKTDELMTYDDQLLVNVMQVTLYTYFGDLHTALDIVRWQVRQLSIHSQFDTLFDAIMHTEAWLHVDCLFRRQLNKDKFAVTVDVTADNGEKKQFKINANTIDVTQIHQFSPSVRQITYSVSGYGLAIVRLTQKFVEEQQSKPMEPIPFQLTQTLTPMKWYKDIKAKTCMTWTPTPRDLQLFPQTFNRTAVIEIEIPSGLRINVRQVGFFLSQIPQVGYMTYHQFNKRLHIFVNIPSTFFGKQICLEWPLERLSTVTNWAPIRTRIYDYLQPEREYIHLTPLHLQPSVLGYSFVKAFHEVRPTPQEIMQMQPPQQQQQF